MARSKYIYGLYVKTFFFDNGKEYACAINFNKDCKYFNKLEDALDEYHNYCCEFYEDHVNIYHGEMDGFPYSVTYSKCANYKYVYGIVKIELN